ncbi:V-type ATP synthase subunit I [Candidatus Latescibacterota bacterium]
MVKIEIVGLLEELDRILDLLQRVGTVQIEELPTIESADKSDVHRIHLDKTKEHLLAKYEELSLTVNEILGILKEGVVEEIPFDAEIHDKLYSLGPEELLAYIAGIAREIRRFARHKRNLLQDIESAKQYEILINTFLPLLEKAGPIENLEQIGIILKKGESSVLPVLKNRISEITGPKTLLFHQKMPDDTIGVYIVVDPKDLSVIRQLLSNEGIAEHHIPREFRKDNLRDSIESIRSRIEDIPRELEQIDSKLLVLKKSNIALLRFIHSLSMDRLNQLRILSRLIRTQFTFVISGWTPASSLDSLKNQLHKHFDNRIYIEKVRLNELDYLHIPTLLTNRGFFRAFEVLTKLLPPPKYGNVDATPFITIFFPIFYGIILGDMAYGLVLLTIAGIIKWKASKGSLISDIGTIAISAGFFTILFGFMYGEFLGDLGEQFGLHPIAPWLHRSGAIEVLLLLALGLGAIHIILGFALRTYVGIIMKHVKGIIEGLAKITVILGIISIFTSLFLGFPTAVRNAGYIMLGVGLLGVILTEGFIGFLEMFSVFGNILSYSRIMAIGLASVILAIVANRLARASHSIVLGILIGFFIHMINFIMGVFSPTIHSLRLHYVEFFSKFFLPSGRQFQPFKKIGGDIS